MRTPGIPRAAVVLGAGALALVTAAALRYGPAALALPVAAVGALALLQRPRVAVALAVGVMVVCEGRSDDLLGFAKGVYDPLPFGPTPAECLLALAALAVLLDRLARQQPLRLVGPLTLPLLLVVLATVAGAVTGHFEGVATEDLVFAARQLAWLVVVPLLVVNVIETERQARGALAFGAGLAVLKAAVGVAGVAAGVGVVVEGSTITYYDPTANWLILLAILGVFAAVLVRARPPVWLLTATPLLVLSLALSLRRSFWIGAALGVLLVVVLGTRPAGRQIVVISGLLLAAAVWVLALQPLQAEAPIVKRAESLEPTRVEQNAQDRYRIDELRNVTAELRRHPVTGLGLGGQWTATHPLGVEHENGRSYTHVVAFWWWLKLGILGVLAYLAVMAALLAMSWQAWRRSSDTVLSAAGLAFLCGLLALAVVETVGSFTGVDPRFTALVGAVGGLLVVMRRFTLRPV
ncbi:MAG TPA: O-antigen ligase family protein [Candidatus Limnocylindrales bacterium]